MIMVGLTGGIGHGKTTLAKDLAANGPAARHMESSDLIVTVANALRAASAQHPPADDPAAITDWLRPLGDILDHELRFHVSDNALTISREQLSRNPQNYAKLLEYLHQTRADPKSQKLVINNANKAQFRSLLQWLGGYLVKAVHATIWYDEIIRRIKATPGAELVTIGGVRFPSDAARIRQAGGIIVEIRRPDFAQTDIQDLTERERNMIKPDILVINNADLPALRRCADRLYQDLSRTGGDNQQRSYLTSDFS